ncbi:MAG: CapA family protein [Ruminiclostridium sp.]|nr:CapA family protein [Ruminiclostridium sp.]
MNRKILSFAAILVVICALLVALGVRQDSKSGPSRETSGSSQAQQEEQEPTEYPDPITATLAVCGDVMSHSPQTKDAYDAATDTYSYMNCFQQVAPWIEQADYAVANFETTLNGPPYSGYPQFCAPDALAYNMKEIGFDLVTTANNHSMDKGFNGVVRTLDTLDAAGLEHVGSYRTQAEYDENKGVEVVDVGGIQVAFLSYTYGTNGIPISDDNSFCLNRFNTDYMAECSTLDEAKLKAELTHAESLGADAIAVMIHWGIEYQFTQNNYQNTVADFLIANGADIILGSHSHVPQPIQEERTVTLADGSTRTGFVSFSLGNFVSNQSPATVNVNYTDTTAVLNLELTKNFETGETTVTGVNYVPLLVFNRGVGAADQYLILDVHKAMAAYESGDTSLVTANLYSKLQYALEGCHNILGAQYDIENVQTQTA